MSYYEFELPAPVHLAPNPAKPEDKAPYFFTTFLGEIAWEYPRWSELAWSEAQVRIQDAIDAAATTAGGKVRLYPDDFEKLSEACERASIKGPHAPMLRRWSLVIRKAKRVAENPPEARDSQAATPPSLNGGSGELKQLA